MSKEKATQKDAVFDASIEFIKTLTGMEPPPIEIAPPEVLKPFREFTEKVCSIFHDAPPQRTWVGLTDDDKVLIKHDANYNQFMTAGEYADRVQQLTEARLKDKNT
jgi:hypothetical protein